MARIPSDLTEATGKGDVAIAPVAIPVLAEPAGLSTVAVLMRRATGNLEAATVYVAIAITGAISYLTRRSRSTAGSDAPASTSSGASSA